MNNSLTEIKAIKTKDYDIKKSKLEIADQPAFRSIVLAPSNSGKTTLLVHLILHVYKHCFSRIYIFSPSINSDDAWIPVKKYIRSEFNINEKKEKLFFEDYNEVDLQNIINTHKEIIEYLKNKKDNDKLYN